MASIVKASQIKAPYINSVFGLLSIVFLIQTLPVHAESMRDCLSAALQSATDNTTVGELRKQCEAYLLTSEAAQPVRLTGPESDNGAAGRRINLESYAEHNPFVLTSHRPNYFLPFSYNSDPNESQFREGDGSLDNMEFQFQVSFKFLLWDNLIGNNGILHAAYTNRSFWQSYNSDISAPFRETNHEPELMLSFRNDWEIFGFENVTNQLIFNHQSNGRSGTLSRSWNRVMCNFIFARENFAMSFKPWYRVPENEKVGINDPSGDDNPDITDFLGHFEWVGAYRTSNGYTWSLMIRDPVTTSGKGAYEAGWSFPLTHRVRGYIKYFSGYGESLIDYNVKNNTVAIGFQLTDWL